MKPVLVFTCLFVLLGSLNAQKSDSTVISSPDGKVQAFVSITKKRDLVYSVSYSGVTVLHESKLGLVMEEDEYATGIRWKKTGEQEAVLEGYKMLTAKKSLHHTRPVEIKTLGSRKLLRFVFADPQNQNERLDSEST